MKISDKDKEYLLSLKPDDITKSLFSQLLEDKCKVVDGKVQEIKSRFSPSDTFVLKKGEYFNKEDVETTIGRFLYNKFIIEPYLQDIIGYFNKTINKKVLGDIEEILGGALLEDKITTEQFHDYINRTQWLGANMNHMLTPSFTMGILTPNESVIKERDKLLAENKDKIDKGDVTTAVLIEKKLIDKARNELASDPGMDLFKSGARGSFENNYKNQSIMKGPTYNAVENKFEVIDTNFMEGIKKDHMHLQGNAIVAGAFPKAI